MSESLSLRQRAPAMLLKKLDEFEEKAQRVWARHEMQKHNEDVENNRKVWGNNRCGFCTMEGISVGKGAPWDYRVFNQLKGLGWVGLDLSSSTILTSCSADSAEIPSA